MSVCITVTVGNSDAGVLFLWGRICVGGDMNSVMLDNRGFVLSDFGVLFRGSGIFVDDIMTSVDSCLRSGTKWLVVHERPLQGPSLDHSIAIL